MDPAINLPPLKVPSILRAFGLRPQKSLGQNFLIDTTALENIVRAAEISSEQDVLEIGPGAGSLTRYLASAARRVVAVELDHALIPVLRSVLSGWENVSIVQGDILDLDPEELMEGKPYQVVANIPYYITSALIRHLLESGSPPERLVLTIQKEVAERICAAEKYSLLALSIQVYGKPTTVLQIPAGSFYPPPKVDSKVIRIDLYDRPLVPAEHLDTFFKLAKAGFSQKRKTLLNALSGGLGLSKDDVRALLARAEVDPQRRAETLQMEEWGNLAAAFLNNSQRG